VCPVSITLEIDVRDHHVKQYQLIYTLYEMVSDETDKRRSYRSQEEQTTAFCDYPRVVAI